MDTKTVAIRTKAKEAASSINTDMLLGARGSGVSKEDNKEKNQVCPMGSCLLNETARLQETPSRTSRPEGS